MLQTRNKTLEQRQEARTKLMELIAMSGRQFREGCGPLRLSFMKTLRRSSVP